MSLIEVTQLTMASSMMIWSYGWERQPSPISRNSMGFYTVVTHCLRMVCRQGITASIYPIVSFHWCIFHSLGYMQVPCEVFLSCLLLNTSVRTEVETWGWLFSIHSSWSPFLALTSTFPDFPVQYFQGRKEVILTTLTWFGGQNHFLPIAYLVTSSLILLMAIILTVIWWKFGKNMKEWMVKNLLWNGRNRVPGKW